MTSKSKENSGDGGDDIYNTEAAEILANEALLLPVSEAAPIYEKLLSTFPTAAKYWKQYVEAYIAVNNENATKNIFSRCLLNCLQISLWHCYVQFIRKVNDKRGPEGFEETKKAYDFMLDHVGSDIGSGPVWMEYIAFLKTTPANTVQEESQRMTSLRKVYQKAVVIPTHHLEQLWKDYDYFENSVSRSLAKGLLSEYQQKFNSAKAVYKELRKHVDDVDWNMLAAPPSGSHKEQQQCLAWKRLLAFEKGNPQRIDIESANRRVILAYEQCLMYLYHYPDVWFDYAMWNVKVGSMNFAVKVFQRALKALPDCEILKYAYAELEESRGESQSAKRIYESLLASNVNSSLAHIQFIRFVRRTEGAETARKYFLEARKSPNCTYHVYVAYAMVVFCMDKDTKVAQTVYEAGLKRFMHEPRYVLEYADFLCRLNDERNVRALFERALSILPPEDSVEVWKRFSEFEQMYGQLSSILKVEQRRKEALSKTEEEGSSYSENTLYDVVSRNSFMDLWPCSSKDLDYLFLQEWLVNNVKKKDDRPTRQNGGSEIYPVGAAPVPKVSSLNATIVLPDTSQMIIYDPRQSKGSEIQGAMSVTASSSTPLDTRNKKDDDETPKILSPMLVSFIKNLPAVEGPSPNLDIVLSILLQCTLPVSNTSKPAASYSQQSLALGPKTSDFSGSNKAYSNQNGSTHRPPRDAQTGKRKELERHEEDTMTTQSRTLPRDIFKLRQIRKTRGVSSSQTGSAASGGSVFSGEQSISTE